jgi:hypothetical protein
VSERRLTRLAALLLMLPAILLAILAFAGVEASLALQYAGGLLVVVVCFGGWVTRDPVGAATVIGPAILVSLVGLLRFPEPTLVSLAVLWLLAWQSPLARRLWPAWEHNVLRRLRSGTPEREMIDASNRLTDVLARKGKRWEQSSKVLDDAWQWVTPQTLPVLCAMQSWRAVAFTGSMGEAFRVKTRWGYELGRLHGWVDRPWDRARMDIERRMRLTRGTCLDYEYPRLEALLAAATASEQRRMGVGAARIALEGVGLLTEARAALLDAAAAAAPPDEVVASAMEAAKAHPPAPADAEAAARAIRYREAMALRSLASALPEPVWPNDAADPIYAAAKSLVDPWETAVIESMMAETIGSARAATAEPIAAIPRPGVPSEPATWRPSTISTLPRTARALGWLIGSTFLAGTIAHLAAHGFHVLIPEWDEAFHVAISAVLTPFLLVGVRARRVRLDDSDVFMSVMVTTLTLLIGTWVVPGLIDMVGGSAPEIVYAVFYGVACSIAAAGIFAFLQITRPRRPAEILQSSKPGSGDDLAQAGAST